MKTIVPMTGALNFLFHIGHNNLNITSIALSTVLSQTVLVYQLISSHYYSTKTFVLQVFGHKLFDKVKF